jgi:hypothetical protein
MHYRRILCQNRLEAYELITPEFPIPSSLTIRDAIEFSAAAWDSVTQTTIKNSWYRTGILPPSMALDNDLVAVDPLSDDAEAEQELIVLIDRMLHISDPLTVEEYILVDNQVVSKEQMTDEEIVKFVNSEDTQEPENNEESESLIKVKDALEGLANVVKYVQHNNLGGVDFVTMKTLNSLKHQILRKDIENKHQSSIIQFFQ